MKKLFLPLIVIGCLASLASCDSQSSSETQSGAYVVAATSDEATYLLQSDNLSKDSLTIYKNGVEAVNATEWVFYNNTYLYRLVYNQGDAASCSAYQLNSTTGEVEDRGMSFSTSRFTTYGIYGDYVMTAASASMAETDSNGNAPYGITFSLVSTTDNTVTSKTISAENFLGNGEYVNFSGLLESGGKIYTGVVPMGVSAYGVDQGWDTATRTTTNYYDSVWVAVYDGMDFSSPTIIKDDRLSYASSRYRSQYYTNLVADDDKDIYVFSSSYDSRTSKHSGVLKIDAGTTAFDSDFYIDIESLSGGYHMFKAWYITGNYFVLQLYSATGAPSATGTALKMAALNTSTKTLTWITGLPDESVISAIGKTPLVDDGKLYMSVTTTDGNQPRIYIVNPSTATATAGKVVTSTGVVSIGKLLY